MQKSVQNEELLTEDDNVFVEDQKHSEVGKVELSTQPDSELILFVTYIVVGTCQGCFFIYHSLLPYLSKSFGMDSVSFGYLQTGAGILQLALGPFIGRCGDRFGSRAILILSAMSLMLGHVTLGLATSASWLIFSRLTTVGMDIRLGSQKMVSDLVSGSKRSVAMAKLALPMSLGMLIGPALGGQLAKLIGSQESMLITWMAPAACIAVMLLFIPPGTRPDNPGRDAANKQTDGPSMSSLIKQKSVGFLVLMKLLTSVPFMTLAQNLAVIGMREFQLTPQMNGFVLSYNGLVGVIVNVFVIGRLSKRYTEDQLLRLAPIIMTAAYFLLSQTYSVWIMLAVIVPWNLGNAVLDSQIVSRLSQAAPLGKTGCMIGLNASVFQLARIAAPLLGSCIIQNLGFQMIGWFGMFASICLSALVLTALSKESKQKTQ